MTRHDDEKTFNVDITLSAEADTTKNQLEHGIKALFEGQDVINAQTITKIEVVE